MLHYLQTKKGFTFPNKIKLLSVFVKKNIVLSSRSAILKHRVGAIIVAFSSRRS